MASAEQQNEGVGDENLALILRSPDSSKLRDLYLTVPRGWNIRQLKELLAVEHPRRPPPKEQVLIYGGKLLMDGDALLAKVLRHSPGNQGPFTMHLAIRGEEMLSHSTSAPNLSETQRESIAAPTTSAPPPQTTTTATTQTFTQLSPVMALPIVMMNPVVSAAYNAAWNAAYPPTILSAQGGHAASIREQGATAPSSSASNTAPPMVPAIAFFPMGIPVLVPAAAQNQGFQIDQTIFNQPPPQQPLAQRNIHRRRPVQQMGRRNVHGGNVAQPRGRGYVVYRFSLRGLIQLALIIAVLYAYCSREKFIIGVFGFLLLYIFARPIRRLILHYYNARDADGRPQQRGVLHEILAIVLTLISSLFPNWNANDGQRAFVDRIVRDGGDPVDDNPVAEGEGARPHVD